MDLKADRVGMKSAVMWTHTSFCVNVRAEAEAEGIPGSLLNSSYLQLRPQDRRYKQFSLRYKVRRSAIWKTRASTSKGGS